MSEKTEDRVGELLVDPELIKMIEESARFYENVADDQWLVFNKPKYRYFTPDLKAMRYKAQRLSELAEAMKKIYVEKKSA